MNTIFSKVDVENIDINVLEIATTILKNGGLVAFPTETVYGLGANALDAEAVLSIFKVKGRSCDNPLIIHMANEDGFEILAKDVPESAKKLAKAFWPGPLTMIVNKSDAVPLSTTGGLNTVALRVPDHKIALELIKYSKVFIAAPSANISGRPSPTKGEHVLSDMNNKIEMIIDGGKVSIGIESTIIDLTSDIPVILRPGFITKEMIESEIGTVIIDKACISTVADESIIPKAPGMKYKHYAPKGELTIVEGNQEDVCSEINRLVLKKDNPNIKVGIIATKETMDKYKNGIIKVIGSKKDEITIANMLYEILLEFDDLEVEYIYSEGFCGSGLSQAIMNRLIKAAGYKVIKL